MTPWCILRVGGRHTLRLAASLAEDGYEVWTPVETRRVRVPRMNARRVVRLPLMPGFVFARADQLTELLNLAHIEPWWRVLFINSEPAEVADAELDALREAEHMAEPKRWVSAFAKDSEVRITRGSFEGLNGVVKSCKGKEAEIWVTLFGRHHRIKISTFNLKLIGVETPCVAIAA